MATVSKHVRERLLWLGFVIIFTTLSLAIYAWQSDGTETTDHKKTGHNDSWDQESQYHQGTYQAKSKNQAANPNRQFEDETELPIRNYNFKYPPKEPIIPPPRYIEGN